MKKFFALMAIISLVFLTACGDNRDFGNTDNFRDEVANFVPNAETNTQNRDSASKDIIINADNAGKLESISGEIRILGNNTGNIDTVSGEVNIGGDNSGDIDTVSGQITILKNNLNDIETISGEINIGGANSGEIDSVSGQITIGENNTADIETTSGAVNIVGDNNAHIETVSGQISLQNNTGRLETVSGRVTINNNFGKIEAVSSFITIGTTTIEIKRTINPLSNEYTVVLDGKATIDYNKKTSTDTSIILESVGNELRFTYASQNFILKKDHIVISGENAIVDNNTNNNPTENNLDGVGNIEGIVNEIVID